MRKSPTSLVSPDSFSNRYNTLGDLLYPKEGTKGRVRSMPRYSRKSRSTDESRTNEVGDGVREFLVHELPSGMTKQASYFVQALLQAGARYDRYFASRHDWLHYAARRKRLESISTLAEGLASGLCNLDILSRDDLSSRIDPKATETLIGSLRLLSKVATDLVRETQRIGKPRDLAEERWILELVDIYENAFNELASAWMSDTEQKKRGSKFYRLLELSRPSSFPRHGKLSVRQIDRMLKRKRKLKRGTLLEKLLVKSSESS